MAEVNPKVMEMVEKELRSNPDISNPELLEKARGIDKSVEKLTARQFNARYPLQVKRSMSPRKRRTSRKKGGRKSSTAKRPAGAGRTAAAQSGDAGRDQIRKILLQLAKDIAGAEGKGDVVDVIAGIDRYVDRVQKATA